MKLDERGKRESPFPDFASLTFIRNLPATSSIELVNSSRLSNDIHWYMVYGIQSQQTIYPVFSLIKRKYHFCPYQNKLLKNLNILEKPTANNKSVRK